MQTTNLIQNDNDQQVEIKKIGNNPILRPPVTSWNGFFASIDQLSPDFMLDGRAQPAQQQREAFCS